MNNTNSTSSTSSTYLWGIIVVLAIALIGLLVYYNFFQQIPTDHINPVLHTVDSSKTEFTVTKIDTIELTFIDTIKYRYTHIETDIDDTIKTIVDTILTYQEVVPAFPNELIRGQDRLQVIAYPSSEMEINLKRGTRVYVRDVIKNQFETRYITTPSRRNFFQRFDYGPVISVNYGAFNQVVDLGVGFGIFYGLR